jgi:cytochrome b561
MSTKPYQPIFFRILHSITGLLLIGAILTGFWVYNTYDGRFGSLPLPKPIDVQDIHGKVAVAVLLLFPIFAVYSFHAGQRRLIQPDSLPNLAKIGKPMWWVSLQRLMNTLMLLAATFSIISGRQMQEEWLPKGEIDRLWYYLHLSAWAVLVVCLALHLLMNAKVGGLPLLQSVIDTRIRAEDSPKLWKERFSNWVKNRQSRG